MGRKWKCTNCHVKGHFTVDNIYEENEHGNLTADNGLEFGIDYLQTETVYKFEEIKEINLVYVITDDKYLPGTKGVFTSKEKAKERIQRIKEEVPYYNVYPEGLTLELCVLDGEYLGEVWERY